MSDTPTPDMLNWFCVGWCYALAATPPYTENKVLIALLVTALAGIFELLRSTATERTSSERTS